MDSLLHIVLLLLPQIPLIARVTLLHLLRLSPQAHYLDLRSVLVISVLRALCLPSRPKNISTVQRLTLHDPGVKGRIWISKYTAPAPQDDGIKEALFSVIDGLKDSRASSDNLRRTGLVPVEAEWTGYRAGVAGDAVLPPISESARYAELRKECKSPAAVLYFHGGAYYLCDPATHRASTKRLSKLSGARVYSVRYRLAPQNPFPAALLDVLVSYFTLLYPPPGAYHDPIKPEHIVFAGDSAGGNLALVLLQAILELRRQNIKVPWLGVDREVCLPAGVALNSPWLDITQSSSSWETNWKFDYLPRRSETDKNKIPPDNIWPASPPRQSLYVEDAFLAHPLTSPIVSTSWEHSPPIYMCTGWELLADDIKYLAKKLDGDGVKVLFEEYEAMPHCFAMILTQLPGSRRCFDSWAGFIKAVVETPGEVESMAKTIKAKSLDEVPLNLSTLTTLRPEAVQGIIQTRIRVKLASEKTPSKL